MQENGIVVYLKIYYTSSTNTILYERPNYEAIFVQIRIKRHYQITCSKIDTIAWLFSYTHK